ncbi:MAG: disulfide bond formation protein B [Caulobacterales bacterium]
MTAALDPILRRWPLFALLTSAAMLAIAHAFQTFGHLAPCHLCLKQREAYWAAMAVSGVGVVLGFTPAKGWSRRIASAVLIAVFGYGAYLAAFHAGAEWKWWPAPESCSGVAKASASALLALLHGARTAAPACDKAAWVFLGLSMAGWNFLVSLGLIALSALAALKPEAPR